MYQPPQFKGDRTKAAAIMTAHPFASLISLDDANAPFVTHLPLSLEERGDAFYLLGHVAKPNPHWRYLQARPTATVTFLGPHAYLSPQVYPDLSRVPTWNYLAVHCRVEATLIDVLEEKDALLKKLIGDHEPAYAAQWRALGEDYAHKMLAGIVGFELRVTDFECKLKVNQHRPEAHEATVKMYAAGSDDQQALARWMVQLHAERASRLAQR